MTPLTDAERDELNALLATGTALPEKWLHRLFPNGRKAESVGKEYRLVYDGKLTREEVLAQTPAAPWQLVRSFCADRPHADVFVILPSGSNRRQIGRIAAGSGLCTGCNNQRCDEVMRAGVASEHATLGAAAEIELGKPEEQVIRPWRLNPWRKSLRSHPARSLRLRLHRSCARS